MSVPKNGEKIFFPHHIFACHGVQRTVDEATVAEVRRIQGSPFHEISIKEIPRCGADGPAARGIANGWFGWESYLKPLQETGSLIRSDRPNLGLKTNCTVH